MTFGEGRKALQFGEQKINLHQLGKEFEPKAINPTPGAADTCFIISIPIEEVKDCICASDIDVLEGPIVSSTLSIF